MSRIADASARAGYKLPDEDAMQWDAERMAADALMDSNTEPVPLRSRPETIDFVSRRPLKHESGTGDVGPASASTETSELAAAIRRIFLSPGVSVRSVLFCSVPGDRMTDVAWRSAELLASESGKPIAFVEEPSNRIGPETRHRLITQIEWSDDDDAGASAAGKTSGSVGEEVADLLPRFSYVLVNSAVSTADELAALARQVDGVIVIILENATSIDAAQSLVTSLRNAPTAVLGTILATEPADHNGPTIFDLRN